MASTKNRQRVDTKGRNPDKIGSADRVVIIRRSFWHGPHISATGGASRALLLELQAMFNGTNNGTLFLSVRDAADRLGFADLEAASNAIAELESLGLITVTIESSFAIKAGEGSRARAYRLNWIGDDGKCVSADKLPPLDFARLSPRQKRRIARRGETLDRYLLEKKSAVRETRTLMAESVRETLTGAAERVRETRTLGDENGAFPSVDRVRDSLTHILHHIPGQSDEPETTPHHPLKPNGPISTIVAGPWLGPSCEACGNAFAPGDRGKPKRFCSEQCRKRAEAQRRNQRNATRH
jgi:hypothetical protein